MTANRITKKIFSIFKHGSRTYFYSSMFFPADVKNDVFTLYSFVRTADDFVDSIPQQELKFRIFRKKYELSMLGTPSKDIVIDSFVNLAKKRNFDQAWIESFFEAMRQDLRKNSYATMAELETYMYGSAEVIGLMMAKILQLPDASHPYARSLGRSMQYINFIRDINEDLALGRVYFPQSELKKHGIQSLGLTETKLHPDKFRDFVVSQILLQKEWSSIGEEGFKYIPKRYLIPIKTANEMYLWTAHQIQQNPKVIFERKIKPSVNRIILTIIKNIFIK